MSSIRLKPLGVIATIMRWDKPQWWIFNLSLLFYQLVMLTAGRFIGKVDITWREIWKAAQWCHIRLLLNPEPGLCWRAISFTAPEAKFDFWSESQVAAGKSHIYFEPRFQPSQEEFDNLIKAAEAKLKQPTARAYDYIQLLSFLVNFPLWLFCWSSWGRETIKIFNLPASREVCSTGVGSLLKNNVSALKAKLFAPFDTAMISPCLYGICGYWGRAK